MAHYAFSTAGVVTEVIVGRDENDLVEGISSWEDYYSTRRNGQVCKRTSYNTYIDDDGVSQHAEGGTPFRGCYAGIGFTYDEVNDVFIPQGYIYDAVTDTFTPPESETPDESDL
jgi:hypothetical protein